nr:hypothetical protein [Kibdelosporangium sp. MJ126-NF4]CTQ95424.1 hypothetical protein [Kibdelosporangium sp. MJ126-NF4]
MGRTRGYQAESGHRAQTYQSLADPTCDCAACCRSHDQTPPVGWVRADATNPGEWCGDRGLGSLPGAATRAPDPTNTLDVTASTSPNPICRQTPTGHSNATPFPPNAIGPLP